ncbi:MAG: LamG-like jellyroll fold domain-containing protein [Cyclobacteriaceae bacterium]
MSVLLLSMFFLNSQLTAQIKSGVLHIKKNNYNSHINLGIDLKRDLLDKGNAEEATLEFWIKSTQSGNSWILSDLSEDGEGFQLSMSNENTLSFNGLSVDAGNLESGLWHHVAVTIQSGSLSIFVNSIKVLTNTPFTTHPSSAEMHLVKRDNEEIMVTEIRGWNRMRSAAEVEDNQWRSYIFESDFELADLKSVEGLEIIYGTNSQLRKNATNLPVKKLQWRSLANSANGLLSENAKGIAEANGIADLLEVSEVLDHPVLGNQTIFLNASKGEHDDKITLDWPHIANIDGYNIYKNRTLINTIQNVKIRVSERISYEDQSVLPGELYTYRVEGYANEDNAFRPDAVANGFIFPNGRITGNIKTESEIFVENVQVITVPEQGTIPGSALAFSSGSAQIDVNQIQIFRDNPSYTLEFWHHSDNTIENEVFRVGPVTLRVGGSNISVVRNTTSSIIATDTLTEDHEWHHIAVVLSESLNQLYRDGVLCAENTDPFNPDLADFNKFSINPFAVSSYELDELRIWAGKRSAEAIAGNYRHILSGREPGMLLYYRFDMEDGANIYNQALQTKGSYIGRSLEDLNWLEAAQQPAIVYGTFTDSGGNYSIDAVNMGKGAEGINFITSLYKANHTFNPPSREKSLRRSLERDDYVQGADFIDISSLPVAGKVLYREGTEEYPALQGLQFTIDDNLIQGADRSLMTDNAGTFSIGAPLGKHKIAVYNPLQEVSPGVQSLRFDGIDDYATMASAFNSERDGVWSGWFKKSENDSVVQVLMSIGDITLVLKENTRLVLHNEDTALTSGANVVDNEWNYFAMSFEEATRKLTLYMNEVREEVILGGDLSLNGIVRLGAGSSASPDDFYRGNLYLIEYREQYLDDHEIENLRQGEFLESDSLLISYSFGETNQETVRTNSSTLNAEDFVMKLNGPVLDSENIHTYTRKFKYSYKAEGPLVDTEDDRQFDFNVIEPVTGLRFYNETRFGILGNLVIPCGSNIGSWDITVKRTDILSPEFRLTFEDETADELFNDDYTVFSVPNLIPGKYKVKITNRQNGNIQLETPVLDLTQNWESYDFEYRSPMTLKVDVVKQIEDVDQIIIDGEFALKATTEDYISTCDEFLVLEQGKGYLASVKVFEVYNEKECSLDNTSYRFDGDLGRFITGTNGTGKDTIIFQALDPNFKGEYKRSFSITASNNSRTKTEVITGVITGSKQFNTDFTLEAPPNILAVIHDPAGDGSSASLAKGTSFNYTDVISHSGGFDNSIDFSTSLSSELNGGTWVGVGGGAVFFKKLNGAESEKTFSVSENFRFGKTDSKGGSVLLNQTISTSSSGTVPGIASDIYIGYTPIIHVGKGKKIEMAGCNIELSEDIEVFKQERSPLFSITHQHIKSVTIPNLVRLKEDFADNNVVDTNIGDIMYLDKQIADWREIIEANEAFVENAENLDRFDVEIPNAYESADTLVVQSDHPFAPAKVYFPESIAFSGGQSVSYSLADQSANSSTDSQTSETIIGLTYSSSIEIFGSAIEIKSVTKGQYNYEGSRSFGSEETDTYSFSLTDDDIGDQFDVLVKKDDRYAYPTPVFKTAAGRSMCPYETGTQSREGVEIAMKTGESAFGEGDLDDRIAFKVELRNTQVAPEAAGNGNYKTYNVKAYNRKGAIVRLNGSLLGEGGTTVVLETEGPESIKDAVISVSRNPDSPEINDFEDISIVMFSPCEEGGGSLGFFNPDEAGVQLADTLYLTAKFHRPCVEAIDVSIPQQNWIVNGASDDELDFEFQVVNPEESFDELVLEYADPASNIGEILAVISYNSLQATADTVGGNIIYSFTQNVSGLTDGKYKFRLVPSCGAGSEQWRSQTATDWISGSIYRTVPVITEVTPSENTILTEGLITATYDRPVLSSGVNSLNISLRGILGGNDYQPYSANFDHGDDFIEIPHRELISIDSAYTIEFWLKADAMPTGDANIISKGSNYQVVLKPDGSIHNGRDISSSLTPSAWTHIAVVYDGNHNIKTYFDEEIVANLDQVASFAENTDPIRIGGDGFRGQIDEIRIWNTTRSQAEIISYQKDRLLGNEAGLQAYYVLDSIALEGEAIRDFTGNTYGTTSGSLSWITGEEAAPIIVEKVVQDVPIDVILSGERQIIINPKSNFPAFYLEGAQLTAFITDQSISDVYGNKAPGKSWHFVIDRNAVRWNRNNYAVTQTEGSGQEFSLEIFNEGATDATYELTDLPDWLQVIGKNQNEQYELPYGFVHAIRFKTADWMVPGSYISHVKAVTYGEDGARTGLESFYLEVTVDCTSPDYSFDSNAYPEQMLITGNLVVNSEFSLDASDMITAVIDGEIRGTASPVIEEGNAIVRLTVFGEAGESADIHFKVWDASDCREYDGIIESYTYVSGSPVGSYGSPVTFTASSTEVRKYTLSSGYHWISMNQTDVGEDYLSLAAIEGMQAGDSLYKHTDQYAVYNGAWSGTLTSINPLESYVYYAAGTREISVSGEVISPDTDIPLTTGVNWVSYLPSVSMSVDRAFLSLEGESSFTVVGKGAYAEYSADGWVGSLTNLTAGEGYRVVLHTPGTLNYTGNANLSPNRNAAVEEPVNIENQMQLSGWTVDRNEFSAQMYITSDLAQDQLAVDKDYLIGAFAGEELRGVGIPQKIAGRYQYFMVISGSQQTSDSLEFRLIDQNGVTQQFTNRLKFEAGRSLGSYLEPYRLLLPENELNNLSLMQNYPNPFDEQTTFRFTIPESGQVSLKIYDQTGRQLKVLLDRFAEKGKYEEVWRITDQSHKPGIYFYELNYKGQRVVKKLILR